MQSGAGILIGMGASGPVDYGELSRFVPDHSRHLTAFFRRTESRQEAKSHAGLCHDWGSALGFPPPIGLPRHLEAVKVIAVTWNRKIVRPLAMVEWVRRRRPPIFSTMLPHRGEDMILKKQYLCRADLARQRIRKLGDSEMNALIENRTRSRASRAGGPMLTWARGRFYLRRA